MTANKLKDKIGKGVFASAAVVCTISVVAIFAFLIAKSVPALKEIGFFDFLFGDKWMPDKDDVYGSAAAGSYGIFTMIVGTLSATVGALLIGGTLGYFTAIFLAFYCPKFLKKSLSSVINLLAGIPSVVYGFFGIVFLLPILSNVAPNNGSGLLATSLILGIMILPTVVSLSRTSLEAVPKSYYEGSLAMGATHSETVFHIMSPAARSGITASLVLGIGRALGETMAVVMVAGNSVTYPDGLFSSFRVLTANIVLEMGYAGELQEGALIATGALCNAKDYETVFVTNNSVMRYVFTPQSNCKFPENLDELNVTSTKGEVLSKQIDHLGQLVVIVLLRLDNVVQSVDIDFGQVYNDNFAANYQVNEKNGYAVTLNNWDNVYDGKFMTNVASTVDVTVTAPEGMIMPSGDGISSIENWLGQLNLTGATLSYLKKATNDREVVFRVQLARTIDCPHETVILEAGKPATCTEDGIKDKYVCEGCGAAFFDAARTLVWYDAIATIPKGHLCVRRDATPCSEGKDGNIEYYKCQREECGKLFADAACSSEITLEQTIIHDFKTEWSSNKDKHYHECKNCTVIKDEAAHRPDRTEATEDDPVKCLDCGYKIKPALAHTTHHTTLVPGEDATCMKEGKKPYYKCDGCEVKFEDKEATKPITDESTLVIAKAHKFGAWIDEVPATEEKEGTKGHKDCDFCGKHFDEKGTEIADLTIAKLVKAEVTVVGGTGGGRLTVGENATVTAEDKEGKVFKGWKDESGKIVSAEKSYTFKVTGATTLTAVYEDVPAAKKGLSGGAIAGIVIGSVLLAGIGGFAIFWFAVKKKTFADLGVALKKGFTAIGNFFKNLGAKIKALFTKKK